MQSYFPGKFAIISGPRNKLPVCDKILEKAVKVQLEEYLENNKIFNEKQSGFRKNHSCETSLNCDIVNWKQKMEENKIVVLVSIDLKRAFETIDRDLFLKKCVRYGFDEKSADWFKSYLSDRTQQTKIGDSISEALDIGIGIPQGAVLSCECFTLFINDICGTTKFADLSLFADDTTLSIACDDLQDGICKMNEDLERIHKWLCANKLSLNVKKTKALIISRKKIKNQSDKIELSINGEKIEIVKSLKLLGIIIDDRLDWGDNTDYLCKKMLKKFYILKRCEKKLNCYSKILFYNSLVAPHIDYCTTILFMMNDSQISEVQKIQNRFMRLILKMPFRTHIKDMIDMLQWMTVKQRIHFNTLKFIHRMEIGELPEYLTSKLVKKKDVQRYDLRRKNDFQLPNFTKDCTQDSLFYKGIQLYNQFKEKFRDELNSSRSKIKCLMSLFVKENYF
jgi:Reverse transcriptase (RNA-dependent DNA polymerase)